MNWMRALTIAIVSVFISNDARCEEQNFSAQPTLVAQKQSAPQAAVAGKTVSNENFSVFIPSVLGELKSSTTSEGGKEPTKYEAESPDKVFYLEIMRMPVPEDELKLMPDFRLALMEKGGLESGNAKSFERRRFKWQGFPTTECISQMNGGKLHARTWITTRLRDAYLIIFSTTTKENLKVGDKVFQTLKFAAKTDARDYLTHLEKTDFFTVEMPEGFGAFDKKYEEIESNFGALKLTEFRSKNENTGSVLGISICQYPEEIKKRDPQDIINGAVDGGTQPTEAKILHRYNFLYKGRYQAADLNCKSDRSKVYMRNVFVFDGNSLLGVTYVSKNGKEDAFSTRTSDIFNSLDLTVTK